MVYSDDLEDDIPPHCFNFKVDDIHGSHQVDGIPANRYSEIESIPASRDHDGNSIDPCKEVDSMLPFLNQEEDADSTNEIYILPKKIENILEENELIKSVLRGQVRELQELLVEKEELVTEKEQETMFYKRAFERMRDENVRLNRALKKNQAIDDAMRDYDEDDESYMTSHELPPLELPHFDHEQLKHIQETIDKPLIFEKNRKI